ncbi:MAG: hypothetical protein KDC02_19460, partial [Flavobacteriales bacterium]|nr:hypothetical protein [Flavobacteriales bacterium]
GDSDPGNSMPGGRTGNPCQIWASMGYLTEPTTMTSIIRRISPTALAMGLLAVIVTLAFFLVDFGA